MRPGTRVMDAEGHTGTVTGVTRYLTGHLVPLVRWDDGSSVRTGAVCVVDDKENR